MYWWHKSAELVRAGKVKRFGLITTNSISQVRQRKVIDFHLNQKNPIKLIFAIPDHPWRMKVQQLELRWLSEKLTIYKKMIN